MRANKDFVVAAEARTIEVKPSIAAKIYDAQIAGFSVDGAWSPAAIDAIRHSLKELGILGAVPEAKAIYNDQLVPLRFSRGRHACGAAAPTSAHSNGRCPHR